MSKSRAKGTKFETSLLPALRQLDGRVERSALKGVRDAGDFTKLWVLCECGGRDHTRTLVVSAKNCKQTDLSGWLNEAEKQRQNANATAAIVVHKRRGTTHPLSAYVTMDMRTLIRLLT